MTLLLSETGGVVEKPYIKRLGGEPKEVARQGKHVQLKAVDNFKDTGHVCKKPAVENNSTTHTHLRDQ